MLISCFFRFHEVMTQKYTNKKDLRMHFVYSLRGHFSSYDLLDEKYIFEIIL